MADAPAGTTDYVLTQRATCWRCGEDDEWTATSASLPEAQGFVQRMFEAAGWAYRDGHLMGPGCVAAHDAWMENP